jgi:lactose/L-arabinose transport system ATP-binding protein
LHKDLGSTMIYVTHDQVEAMTLADKIVVLRAGIIEQVGSPLGLYNDPDNVFVAGFIGSPRMNFMEVEVNSSKADVLTVTLNEFKNTKVSVQISGPHPKKGSQMLLGVRPEHFSSEGAIKIDARIDVIENLGGASFAYAGADSDEPLTIQLPGNHSAKEGEVYKAGIDPTTVFLFDKQSEKRLR